MFEPGRGTRRELTSPSGPPAAHIDGGLGSVEQHHAGRIRASSGAKRVVQQSARMRDGRPPGASEPVRESGAAAALPRCPRAPRRGRSATSGLGRPPPIRRARGGVGAATASATRRTTSPFSTTRRGSRPRHRTGDLARRLAPRPARCAAAPRMSVIRDQLSRAGACGRHECPRSGSGAPAPGRDRHLEHHSRPRV